MTLTEHPANQVQASHTGGQITTSLEIQGYCSPVNTVARSSGSSILLMPDDDCQLEAA